MIRSSRAAKRRAGFTLPEIMIASVIMILVTTGVMSFYLLMRKVWTRDIATMTTSMKAAKVLNRIVYGSNTTNFGLRAATAGTVNLTQSSGNWTLTWNTNKWVTYNATQKTITDSVNGLLSDNVVAATCQLVTAGATIRLSVAEGSGKYRMTNTVVTFVEYRN